MQIVIDIPEWQYKQYTNEESYLPLDILCAIQNGTPLPKGHGRLIDADDMWDSYHSNDYDFYEALDDVPTIIEAYKESELCI